MPDEPAVARTARRDFKDYYLILQVHPEADGAMVDAAYWHLVRRYNEEAEREPAAKKKIDLLNEAYTTLGSAQRREEYTRLRSEVLGADVLPVPPPPSPDESRAPLSVMRRQKPRPRPSRPEQEAPAAAKRSQWHIGASVLQTVLAIVIMLALATATMESWAHPLLIWVLGSAGILLLTVPLLVARLPRPRLRLRRPRLRRPHLPAPRVSISLPRPRRRRKGKADERIVQLRARHPAVAPSEDGATAAERAGRH